MSLVVAAGLVTGSEMIAEDEGESLSRRSFAEWREMVQFSCGRLHVSGKNERDFHGEMLLAELGDVRGSLVEADPHTVAPMRWTRRGEEDQFVYLCGVLSGQAEVVQDDRAGVAQAGNMVVFDNARPFTLSMATRFRMMVLKIPHRVIGVAPPATAQLTARCWSGARGVAALISPLLLGLAGHMHEFDAATARQVGCSITSLITTLFGEHLRRNPDNPQAGRQAMLLRVQAYVRENLGDPQLTPRMLAKHHHVSVRHLQKLFQEQGLSPASFIRDQRLARCAADLRDPRLAQVPVALVGERWGLSAASHFSRLFREHFGVSPQEYRRMERLPAHLAPKLVDGGQEFTSGALIA